MRTIFRHQKPFQKEFNSIQTTLKVLQNKPKEVLSGTGIPSNLKGQNGNIYIDTSKEEKPIYLKENGKWV